ncbi:MAG: hypothetical protein A4S12_04670 [Proteobacteria bacterium SG_bin5]|nr:MAG: hypothetical protein A4S12_04670 [Proteobacteria bacterium SG_bin5]
MHSATLWPRPCAHATAYSAVAALRLAKRPRATSAAAAAPNSSTIGGAGTGVGPSGGGPPELPVLPEADELALDAEDELDEDALVLQPTLDEP